MTTKMQPLLVVLVLVLFCLFQTCHANRLARPMTLEFFQALIYTSLDSDNNDNNSDTTNQAFWEEHTESNWQRAVDLATQNPPVKYPFILCDQETRDEASLARRDKMAEQAVGMPAGGDPDDYFISISNNPEITCVLASMLGTVAETLETLTVQPVSFLMKINAGSIEFTDAELQTQDEMQYAILFCPQVQETMANRTAWALAAMQTMVPLIPLLVTVPEAALYQTELQQLQTVLQQDATFCDSYLLGNVQAEDAGAEGDEYLLMTFALDDQATQQQGRSATFQEIARTCFHLLTFSLAYAPEVCYMERRLPFATANTVAQWIAQSGVPDERPFFDAGLTGEGQVVAVSDTGLDLQSCYFRDSTNLQFGTNFDSSRRKVVQYVPYVNSGEDVNGHGSHVAGTIAGRKSTDGVTNENGMVDGVAKDAKLAFFDLGKDDATGGLLVPGANTLLNPGKMAGARIHSASWGSSSEFYTNMDRDLDRYLFADESMLMIVAAGNEGPGEGTVRSPAHAKNVLTVGATNSAEEDIAKGTVPVDELAGFSSHGPSMDQRIKPDLVASGAYILSVGSRNEPACDPESESNLPGPGQKSGADVGILSLQGTSMATPVVSGHAALVRQYFLEGFHGNGTKGSADSMDITGTMLKAVLINGAQPLAGYGLNEVDSKQGFGRLSLLDSLPLAGSNDLEAGFLDKETIKQSKSNTYMFDIDTNKTCGSDAELSVTLVWADPPGFVGCLNCVLNDLDLFVVQTSANGTQKAHFPNGRASKDVLNNVERIRVLASVGDSFVVSVTANHLEGETQTYALAAIYGCLNHRERRGFTASGLSGVAGPLVSFGWTVAMALVSLALLL